MCIDLLTGTVTRVKRWNSSAAAEWCTCSNRNQKEGAQRKTRDVCVWGGGGGGGGAVYNFNEIEFTKRTVGS